MKKNLIIIGVILVAIGGAMCWFFNRKAPLFDASEGVCPRCLSHDVRRWEYGLGAMDTEKVIGGGCIVCDNSPQYHCDVCGFNWGRICHIDLAKKHFSGE